MSEWWTYGLSDFLMFSPRVYDRLIAATNAALWPAQIGTTVLGLVAAALIVAPWRGGARTVLPVLGGLWIVVAWTFLWERYAIINWGILYAAPAFALQGILLIVAGLARMVELREPRDAASVAAAALLVAIVLGWPLLALLDGRGFATAESFGLLPDPTALGTLAILAALRGGPRFVLAIVPIAWALVAAATLYTLGSWTWVLVPGATTLAVALALIRLRPPSFRRS